MRQLFLSLVIVFISFSVVSQGLEKVLVERFYSSSDIDTLSELHTSPLKPNSVTYRVFLDLKPGYSLQAVYGTKEHPLVIRTSTTFFNHSEHGDVIPNVIPYRTLSKNTVMLDSWLSVGASAEDSYAIPLKEDDTLETIKHTKFLTSRKKGNLLYKKDGLMIFGKVPRPTFFNLGNVNEVFGNKSDQKELYIDNGGWFCLGGAKGLDSLGGNKVLIGQFTTDGEFSFQINVQLGTPTLGISEKYVAINPTGSDLSDSGLLFYSRKNKLKIFNK